MWRRAESIGCESAGGLLGRTQDERLRVLLARIMGSPKWAPRRVDAARIARCSPATLDRLFGAATGSSYTRWLARWRSLEADRMYRRGDGDLKISACAFAVGLGNRRRLLRAFHRHLGRSPTGRLRGAASRETASDEKRPNVRLDAANANRRLRSGEASAVARVR